MTNNRSEIPRTDGNMLTCNHNHTVEIPQQNIQTTLKQGPSLEGGRLVAALRRLVEIGNRLEREERANGGKS